MSFTRLYNGQERQGQAFVEGNRGMYEREI